jgi:hypothetical protein
MRHRTASCQPLKDRAADADTMCMDVFVRPDIHSQAPATARQEPDPPVFSGSAAEVTEFLGGRMEQRTHTLALVAGELKNLARSAWPTDSLTFVLTDDTSVTIRP